MMSRSISIMKDIMSSIHVNPSLMSVIVAGLAVIVEVGSLNLMHHVFVEEEGKNHFHRNLHDLVGSNTMAFLIVAGIEIYQIIMKQQRQQNETNGDGWMMSGVIRFATNLLPPVTRYREPDVWKDTLKMAIPALIYGTSYWFSRHSHSYTLPPIFTSFMGAFGAVIAVAVASMLILQRRYSNGRWLSLLLIGLFLQLSHNIWNSSTTRQSYNTHQSVKFLPVLFLILTTCLSPVQFVYLERVLVQDQRIVQVPLSSSLSSSSGVVVKSPWLRASQYFLFLFVSNLFWFCFMHKEYIKSSSKNFFLDTRLDVFGFVLLRAVVLVLQFWLVLKYSAVGNTILANISSAFYYWCQHPSLLNLACCVVIVIISLLYSRDPCLSQQDPDLVAYTQANTTEETTNLGSGLPQLTTSDHELALHPDEMLTPSPTSLPPPVMTGTTTPQVAMKEPLLQIEEEREKASDVDYDDDGGGGGGGGGGGHND